MRFSRRAFEDLLGLNERNLEYVFRYNPRRYFPQVDDKIQTKEILSQWSIPVPETLGICDSFVNLESSLETISSFKEIVLKPSKGRAGGGILLLERIDNGRWTTPSGRLVELDGIEKHIGNILFGVYSFGSNDDRVLIEKKIIPAEFFKRLYPDGVADIRIILFRDVPVMAMARIPTSISDGKANLHQGAIGIGIDIKSGRFTSAALKGRSIMQHPDSMILFGEQEIPFWSDVVNIATRASQCIKLDYLGVDVVIDETSGPLILELNARPGLEIQSVNRGFLSRELRRLL